MIAFIYDFDDLVNMIDNYYVSQIEDKLKANDN